MIIPANVPGQPSPRVQELGQRIALAISEFQQRNPDVSAEEIRAAADLATHQVDAPRGTPARAVTAMVAAAVAVGLGAFLYRSPSGGHPSFAWAVGLVAGLVAVIALVNRRS